MSNAWIKPDGVVIELGRESHDGYADRVLKEEMGLGKMMDLLDESGYYYPFEILHDRGWVRVSIMRLGSVRIVGNCISLVEKQKNTMHPEMTMRQMKVAKQICKDNNCDFDDSINDKRFW